MIADPGVDLVVIATPNDSHASLAEQAIRAGKHVVIDKPFVLRAEEGENLIDLARQRGRMMTVFHNRRWDGDFLTVAALLASGKLGEVSLFEAHWDRFRPVVPQGWREVEGAGAGTLWNLSPHMIDQMILLFGMPQAVSADIGSQRAGAVVDDYFELTFYYGAMRVKLAASNLVAAQRPRFSMHGSEGSFVKYGLDPQEDRLSDGQSPLDAEFGNEPAESYGILTSGATKQIVASERGCYLEFYRGVANAIAGSAPLPVDPGDALRGVRLIQAARRSAEEKRAVSWPLGPQTCPINWIDGSDQFK